MPYFLIHTVLKVTGQARASQDSSAAWYIHMFLLVMNCTMNCACRITDSEFSSSNMTVILFSLDGEESKNILLSFYDNIIIIRT